LSGKFTRDGGPNDARRTAFDFPPVDKDKAYDIIDVMKEIGDARGVSVAQIALAWLLAPKARHQRDHRREERSSSSRTISPRPALSFQATISPSSMRCRS
jgi:hypothetical protein